MSAGTKRAATKGERREEWIASLREAAARRRGNGAGWADAIREKAFAAFESGGGLPSTKVESYRFTNFAPLGKIDFVPAAEEAAPDVHEGVDECRLGGDVAAELVFVNGRFAEELSRTGDLPEGVTVISLRHAMESEADRVGGHLARYADGEKNPFAALNTALFHDGLYLHVAEDVRLERPVHAIFYSSAGGGASILASPRSLLIGERGSAVSVIETFAGEGGGAPYWTNAVTEAVVGDGAEMTHYKHQLESEDAYHVGALATRQGKSSRFASYSIAFGGKIARTDIGIDMAGEESDSLMHGLYVVGDDELVDHHTSVDHAVPRCHSDELYKGILTGRSRGVFNGRIFVHQDAQKTNALQSNRNLLLSEDAAINAQPQLEILADDVKCTHGATVGQLDADSLFYFRTRGIDEESARNMLIYAFAAEVVEKIRFEPLRERVGEILYERLGSAAGPKEE